MMKNNKHSIYLTLGIVIILTVTVIMSTHSTYSYINTKNKIIEKMKNDSRTTIISLKNNVSNLVKSYAVNEYENLILNEIERKDIFAIVVEDYNMGKILGKKSYISGKIRDDKLNIVEYDSLDDKQNRELNNCYFSDSFDITTSSGKKLGKISIYISDDTLNKELRKIIKDTFIDATTISLLLIILLFIAIRLFILKPISNIIETINNSDKDGLPIESIPDNNNKEISSLSSTINTMVDSIKVSRTILKENELKLFQALELQTTIFDNSGYMIIRTDTNGIIKQINKETQRLLGYSANDLVDKYTPELIHLKSENESRALEFSKELNQEITPGFDVFIAKTKLGLTNEHEWTYITKDGEHLPILLSVTALRNKDNEINGYLGIGKDITQRKLMASQAKLASMGEMIGNIAHQWRQPLSVISTIASGVKVRSEFDILKTEDIFEGMDNIVKQTQYLSNTIDDFRDFIKNTNNKEEMSVVDTVKKSLSIMDSSIVNHNLNIITDLKDDMIISGFKNQMIQVIINIINNAKDAINEYVDNDENKLITIKTKKVKDNLVLLIQDSAGGISEDVISKVFDPYFTTKHKSIGTGIGLSMAYQIITEHHNASIEVSNETFEYNEKEYTGACFKLTFIK